jgi:hypothetical protein
MTWSGWGRKRLENKLSVAMGWGKIQDIFFGVILPWSYVHQTHCHCYFLFKYILSILSTTKRRVYYSENNTISDSMQLRMVKNKYCIFCLSHFFTHVCIFVCIYTDLCVYILRAPPSKTSRRRGCYGQHLWGEDLHMDDMQLSHDCSTLTYSPLITCASLLCFVPFLR